MSVVCTYLSFESVLKYVRLLITACNCNNLGSVNNNCNANGQCSCKAGYSGQKCNKHRCAGWKIVNGICYKGFSQEVSWNKAKHTCTDMGAILAEPRSSSENEAIISVMEPISKRFWIGINDINLEKT